MDGNNGKAIASMTIKQSSVDACVCVCIWWPFKETTPGTTCSPSISSANVTNEPTFLKHIRSCSSSHNLGLSRTRSTWICVCPPPPHPWPHRPSVPVSLSREHTASSFYAVCRYPTLSFSTSLDSLCLHLSLHKMDKMSFHLPPSIRGLLNWPVDLNYVPNQPWKHQ